MLTSQAAADKVNKDPCLGSIHPQALLGIRLFNQRAYFEAHEALEEAWRAEAGPARYLYQGILQIGVAYYHILHGNYRGAVNLLRRGCQHLNPYPDVCKGIDLAQLRLDARNVDQVLRRLGPEGIKSFDQDLFKPIRYNLSTHIQQK